jgi:hypothetical protein
MAPDKIAHMKAGMAVAVASALAGAALLALGLHGLSIVVMIACAVAGMAVGFAQHETNRRLQDAGKLPLHDVSPDDALASMLPGALLGSAIEAAIRGGVLPL